MNTIGFIKTASFTFKLTSHFSASANPFLTQLRNQPLKNAARFENKNLTWTFDEFETHSNAFAYGLVELGYQPGDRLLFWIEKNHTAEVVTAQVGSAKAGVSIIPCKANSIEELSKIVKDTDVSGVLFSPNSKLGEEKYIDVLNKLLPELAQTPYGGEFKSSTFSKLRHLIHTGFYTHPGTYKFRQILVYASKNFNTLKLPEVNLSSNLFITANGNLSLQDLISKTDAWRKKRSIDENDSVFVAGDPQLPLSFATGILNTLIHGNFSVYTGGQTIKEVGQSIKLYNQASLVVDNDIYTNGQQNVFEEKALQAVKSVSLFNTNSKINENDVKNIFKGKDVVAINPLNLN